MRSLSRVTVVADDDNYSFQVQVLLSGEINGATGFGIQASHAFDSSRASHSVSGHRAAQSIKRCERSLPVEFWC